MHYIRTCSNNLNMRMPIALVCMKESRPGDGHLCFCQRDRCNAATGLHRGSSRLPTLIFSFMTLLLIRRYFSGHFNVTRWWTEVICDLVVFVALVLHQQLIHPWKHRQLDGIKEFKAG